jgi:hypothetical protein
VKPYRASIDFCLAAESIEEVVAREDRLIEAAEKLGIYFQFASNAEMPHAEVEAGSPLADALNGD